MLHGLQGSMTIQDQIRIREGLLAAAEQLHTNAGFVHGDIRDANVFIDTGNLGSLDPIKFHIIDFDWAGRVGEVAYPYDINYLTVARPNCVVGGSRIETIDDMLMIKEHLFPL